MELNMNRLLRLYQFCIFGVALVFSLAAYGADPGEVAGPVDPNGGVPIISKSSSSIETYDSKTGVRTYSSTPVVVEKVMPESPTVLSIPDPLDEIRALKKEVSRLELGRSHHDTIDMGEVARIRRRIADIKARGASLQKSAQVTGESEDSYNVESTKWRLYEAVKEAVPVENELQLVAPGSAPSASGSH